MDAPSYLQDEARACLNLAQIEEHSEMKVILMGMALGWLSIAKGWEPSAMEPEVEDRMTDDMEPTESDATVVRLA
jgi:hypothetical protein